MSLLYPAASIPTVDRCPPCEGTGDEWRQVCEGHYGDPIYESVGECRACEGTGVIPGRPLPTCEAEAPSWLPLASVAEVATWALDD